MGKRARPREIFSARPHPKASFGVEGSAVRPASSHQGHGRYVWDSFEGERRSGEAGVTSLPHTALRIKDEGVFASPVHLNRLRALPGDRCGCELVVLVTETELTFAVVSKSQKGPFEGEEERVPAQGHSNE